MLRVNEYTMDQLTCMKNELIDRISNDYYSELDRNNNERPSDALVEVMSEYRTISNEIERRMSNVRKFISIIDSGRTVKDYYETTDKLISPLGNDEWYSVHHDYRISY